MKFRYYHCNINVFDLEKSIAFYEKALGLTVAKRKKASDGSYEIVFMTDGDKNIELTWLRDREPHRVPGGRLRGRARPAPGDGLHLLRKRKDGPLLHQRPGRLLAGDTARRPRQRPALSKKKALPAPVTQAPLMLRTASGALCFVWKVPLGGLLPRMAAKSPHKFGAQINAFLLGWTLLAA